LKVAEEPRILNPLKVYNTMSQRKEVFRPLVAGKVKMFVCGPTVQGPIHLGHARTYIFYDVVARYLSHLRMKVEFLMNITDVDERITSAAREGHLDPEVLASRFTQRFFQDLLSLGITTVTRFEPVSRRVPDAMKRVSQLLDSKHAYSVDGWVYFDTAKFPRFGQLSHQSRSDLALRPLELSSKKKHLADFSLWRPEGLVPGKWKSPWGMGSPGWHIQDTAITLAIFGKQYDIHGGAYELIYPHHEAEIAQGESLTGVSPIVRYWVHTHLVTMEGEKMSKSIGNVYSVADALKTYTADELRFYFLLVHYRSDMDLSGLEASSRRLQKLRTRLAHFPPSLAQTRRGSTQLLLRRFYDAMNDDFNTPLAVEALEDVLAKGDQEGPGYGVRQAVELALGILGVKAVGQ
jgi:cysteinyl-tRNA synthetase